MNMQNFFIILLNYFLKLAENLGENWQQCQELFVKCI